MTRKPGSDLSSNPFLDRTPNILGNALVRLPQQEAFKALAEFAASNADESQREVGIVLPVGCGKSGTITLTPFAFRAKRVLVAAPGLNIASQLAADFDPANGDMFYQKCRVLTGGPYPEPVEIRGDACNIDDLKEAHVVVTNVQQLQGGASNRWLQQLPNDFFDLIVFDEGHHGVAASWELLKAHFPGAKVVNFSATPQRADGQMMAGRIIYSYPISDAIRAGYVKQLKAVQLNPRSLKYVRRADGQEIVVPLEEVVKLGEDEADFRRSIVTSRETLDTIVDASIRQLEKLRKDSNEPNLKIIASALNYEHCRQIVEAYSARGKRAGYVHSRDGAANVAVLKKLESHDLDVIVQVRKLGEGFDHKYLAVAAVFSIFSNLSPFVQFVGRIMRVVKQNAPEAPVNRGVVVFHAGANIACRWADFQNYTQADREYFDQLLPLEGLDPADMDNEREVTPSFGTPDRIEVRAQDDVHLEEIPLLPADEAAAIRLLQERGIIPESFDPSVQSLRLEPVPTTKVRERAARQQSLDMRSKTDARRILGERNINPEGRELDKKRLNKTNLIVLKSAIDRQVNTSVGHGKGQRHEMNRQELDQIDEQYPELLKAAVREVFGES
jgi:superfamily II DNA or RNA helicase